jgi:hypothetical protein
MDNVQTGSRDELIARARERAESPPTPEEWGYRIRLDPDEVFVGRYGGETIDEDNDNRRIFLFWDEDGEECFSRTYAALAREIDRVRPGLGDRVVIARGPDYQGAQGTGYSFGVESEPSDEPLPGAAPGAEDDDIPF